MAESNHVLSCMELLVNMTAIVASGKYVSKLCTNKALSNIGGSAFPSRMPCVANRQIIWERFYNAHTPCEVLRNCCWIIVGLEKKNALGVKWS